MEGVYLYIPIWNSSESFHCPCCLVNVSLNVTERRGAARQECGRNALSQFRGWGVGGGEQQICLGSGRWLPGWGRGEAGI